MSTDTSSSQSVFWDDLAEELQDPEFRHHFILESERIAAVDRIVNKLDELREELGLSKADLARAVERRPEAVRRLLTSPSANPQLSLVAELAAALGYRVELVPMTKAEVKEISVPLRELTHA